MKFAKILIGIVIVIAAITVGIVYAFERVASYVTIASSRQFMMFRSARAQRKS